MNIGVCGLGVVGSAVASVFARKHPLLVRYDIDRRKLRYDFEPLLDAELIFLCLPTPTLEDGRQDLNAISATLLRLSQANYKGVVCIKSTILPGTTKMLARNFGLTLAHNPEFLTERSANADFINQPGILIGSESDAALTLVAKAYRRSFPKTPIHTADDPTLTEMAKYIHNCFLATKVSFFNEMFNLCEKAGVTYPQALNLALTQGKILPNHTKVPGPDGQFGYGGMCFPKDMSALSQWAGADSHMLSFVQIFNLIQRSKKCSN